MNCLIIEDEPLAMQRLQDYVARVPFLHLAGSLDNCLDAIDMLHKQKIDLIFLDIEMDGFSGLDLLKTMTERPAVVLTTAYDQYALRAFELQVTDYLLKPFGFDRFMQAVLRVKDTLTDVSPPVQQPFLFIKTEYRLQKVNLNQILFIEGMRDYRRIHLENEKIMTLETFGELERQLPGSLFCRVHKSYLVAINKIESIERDRINISKILIPISDTYRANFYRAIGRG